MIDPFADTIRAAVAAAESTAASGGALGSWIQMVLERRPIWAAQMAAMEFARQSATTAPLWRWIRIPGPNFVEVARGTSMTATVSGAAGLAVTMGIPLAVAVGSWVMLGAGYKQALEEVKRRGFMSGFSQGFTTGVLNWTWDQAVNRFAKRFVIYQNTFYRTLDREEALSYNEGLRKGWAAGNGVPTAWYDKTSDSIIDKKKSYRIALRKLAGRTDSGPWSSNWDEARLQQVDYVIALAASGMKHGLIQME